MTARELARMAPVPGRVPHGTAGAWCASRSDGARLHAGIDLWGPVGREVHAPEAGEVVVVASANVPSDPVHRSEPRGWAGYGPELVVMRGDSGAFHLLAHLGTVAVRVGQRLALGELIGTIGRTSSPHLHWEVRSRLQPTGAAAVVEVAADPEAWLEGRWAPWDGRCPSHPGNTTRTPRACRPAWRGPAPLPFPPPGAPSLELVPMVGDPTHVHLHNPEGAHG